MILYLDDEGTPAYLRSRVLDGVLESLSDAPARRFVVAQRLRGITLSPFLRSIDDVARYVSGLREPAARSLIDHTGRARVTQALARSHEDCLARPSCEL